MQLKIKRLDPRAQLPEYKSPGASGLDLSTLVGHLLYPGRRVVLPTGIAVQMPIGFEGQIRSRSGLSAEEGIIVLNSPGTIDSDYRGEIKLIIQNNSRVPYRIEAGDRLAQLVICPISHCTLVEVDRLTETKRGEQGLGSTGINVTVSTGRVI